MSGLTEKQYVLKKGGLFVGFFGSRVCNELIYLFFKHSTSKFEMGWEKGKGCV